MCGIAGFMNFDNYSQLADRVNSIQGHRGPDHNSSYIFNRCLLCNQRLAIIDPDPRSHQPFEKEDLVITYNGELYNYKELKRDLIKNGIQFITNSDTEVILEMFRAEGPDCLKKFLGMFTFAILDKKKEELFLARDHFGIKPLFYYSENKKFAFSSELKTLLEVKEIKRTLNFSALVSSINYLWIPGNNSMFNEIMKLPSGCWMRIDHEGRTTLQSYYTFSHQGYLTDEPRVLKELDQKLTASVRRHMIADVPISAFLSGGLDSSLICAMASNNTDRLSTFSIKLEDKDLKIEKMGDDSYYAKQVAKKLQLDHHEITINPKMIDLLPTMVYHLDEPIGDPAAINTYLMSKAAHELGVKVILSGMGADEIFFGYRRQKATLLSQQYQRFPEILRNTIRRLVNGLPVRSGKKGHKYFRWAKRFLQFADLPFEEAYFRSYSYYNGSGIQDLFRSDINREYTELRMAHADIFNSYPAEDKINRMCNMDIHYFMQGLNLTYTDRSSMAASVEVRVPYVDREIIEFAMSVDGQMKYKKNIQKYPLKKIAERYLPKEIIYRPKASFGAPIRSWISKDLSPLINDVLAENSVNRRGIFNYNEIKRMIETNKLGLYDYSYQIYQLLTVELWFQKFVD